MIRVAVIGCGNIGTILAKAIDEGVVGAAVLVALYDVEAKRCRVLASRLRRQSPRIVEGLEELLSTGPHVVVEAASQEAVRQYGPRVLEAGADLVALSVGALMDEALRRRLAEAARRHGRRVYVPSGALAGLDAVYALSLDEIRRVRLVTRKPPRSLGLPEEPPGPVTLYRGPAGEAVKRFPANVNVAAALSLAAGREAEVEVVADPGVEQNIHEVYVDAEASRLYVRVENRPSPSNPRTSLLAALSAIALLRRLADEAIWIL